MAAEYLANATQTIPFNAPAIFTASIPCAKGYVYHEDETGVFILRGIVNCPQSCYAVYRVTFNGNIALPDTATDVIPIAMALTVNGEPRPTSKAIYTPAAVDEFGNITSTAIIKTPRGCCLTLSVENIAADPEQTDTPAILLQNANLVIDRIA